MKIWVAIFNEKGQKIEEKELREYRVTGWEDAPSHKNLPRLAVIGGMQSPLDMAMWASGKYNPKYKYVFFCKDERVKVIARGKTQGNYIAVRGNETGTYSTFVHVNGHDKYTKGSILDKEQAICKIAPKTENGGYPEHLHIDEVRGKQLTRDLIFYKVEIETCEQKVARLEKSIEVIKKELAQYKVIIDEKNTLISAGEHQVKRLNGVLSETSSQLQEALGQRDEYKTKYEAMKVKKKAQVSLEDLTMGDVLRFVEDKKYSSLRLRVLNLLEKVLPYLFKGRE